LPLAASGCGAAGVDALPLAAIYAPAAALGHMFSDTFAGIAASSVPGFVVAVVSSGALVVLVARGFASAMALLYRKFRAA